MALGFTVSQVVHDYGDICQAITELAIEQNAPITTDEFRTLNRLSRHGHRRGRDRARAHHGGIEVERRSPSDRAMSLTRRATCSIPPSSPIDALKRGTVAINGSTGAVLGRSLMGLRDLVDSTLSEIRIAASQQRRERVAGDALPERHRCGWAAPRRVPGAPAGGRAGRFGVGGQRRPAGAGICGDQSAEQRLQVHARWRHASCCEHAATRTDGS